MKNKLNGNTKYSLSGSQILFGKEVLIGNIGRMTTEQAQLVVDRLNGKKKTHPQTTK